MTGVHGYKRDPDLQLISQPNPLTGSTSNSVSLLVPLTTPNSWMAHFHWNERNESFRIETQAKDFLLHRTFFHPAIMALTKKRLQNRVIWGIWMDELNHELNMLETLTSGCEKVVKKLLQVRFSTYG